MKKTLEQIIGEFKNKHGDKFDYSRVVYTNIDTPVEIICPKHGLFKSTPYNHTKSKHGCLKCGIKNYITLDELKRTSGGKSVSSFNKIFKEYLDIKPYWVDNGFYYLTRRNIYHIPAMEEQCITISNKFALIELDAAIKGFFIQLLLLSQYGNIELIKKNIIKAIGIDKKTYDKYIIKLVGADLVSITTPLTLHTENILLENDFSKQKKLPTKKVNKIAEIDDNGNIIIPK